MPPVTLTLIAVNVGVFLLQQAAPGLEVLFALWPLGSSQVSGVEVGFEPWQLVTYAFLHGNLVHIAFNMFALWMFGGPIEQVFGTRRYLIYYFVCVVSAAVAQLAVSALTGAVYPSIGASGGVFGLLLAYAIYFPRNRIMLLFPPIPMPARVFVVVYALLELFFGVTGTQEGVAHFAHLGGLVGGFLLLYYWRGLDALRRRF
ncbi:MAG TPA: rhomboid family intramembrane serine protease [Casimicrobiaceae bacterium]|jgi:membrane associated rhomboid family serine protease|nr:rhomboid family intramembrane serine protease [Casimicrobiaceae bacterium]